MAGQLGGIEPLFDTLFSFLYRKTDYFHVMQPGDKMGFRAGVAQQILLRSFKKYEQAATAATRRAERPQQGVPPLAEPSKPSKPAPTAAATATATKGGTPTATAAPKAVAADAAAPKAPSARTNKSPEDAAEVPPGGTSDGGAAPASVAVAVAEGSAAAPAASATSAGARVVSAAGAKSASHLAEQVGVPYNGGRTAAYYWEQTLSDVTIHAPVPAGTRARDVICTISRNHLFLKLRAAGADAPIVDADFPCDARNGQEVWERVKAVESYWNLGEVDGAAREPSERAERADARLMRTRLNTPRQCAPCALHAAPSARRPSERAVHRVRLVRPSPRLSLTRACGCCI